jgi:hypothetical protein
VAALLMQKFPKFTAKQIFQIILESAVPLGSMLKKPHFLKPILTRLERWSGKEEKYWIDNEIEKKWFDLFGRGQLNAYKALKLGKVYRKKHVWPVMIPISSESQAYIIDVNANEAMLKAQISLAEEKRSLLKKHVEDLKYSAEYFSLKNKQQEILLRIGQIFARAERYGEAIGLLLRYGRWLGGDFKEQLEVVFDKIFKLIKFGKSNERLQEIVNAIEKELPSANTISTDMHEFFYSLSLSKLGIPINLVNHQDGLGGKSG